VFSIKGRSSVDDHHQGHHGGPGLNIPPDYLVYGSLLGSIILILLLLS
jgi:hypothetical protein